MHYIQRWRKVSTAILWIFCMATGAQALPGLEVNTLLAVLHRSGSGISGNQTFDRLAHVHRIRTSLTIFVQTAKTDHSTRIFFKYSDLYFIACHELLPNQCSRFCVAHRSATIVSAPSFGTLALLCVVQVNDVYI